MNPTLGYVDDVELSKDEIARIQLIEAINQFLQENWICSITLAGAAEAVFAGILEKNDLSSVVEDSTEAIDCIRGLSDVQGKILNPMQGKMDKHIYNEWNEARNHLKHHNKKEQSTVTLNLFDEAYWMIKRALANAKKAEVAICNEQEFENWIIININL
ncbi:MAG: hypothetical protein ACOYB1_10160 [Limnohabitans sp.]